MAGEGTDVGKTLAVMALEEKDEWMGGEKNATNSQGCRRSGLDVARLMVRLGCSRGGCPCIVRTGQT